MQPSMGTLNSPSSRIVKDLTPSRCRILRYINFGIGASKPILFLDMVNLHLIIFEAWHGESWTNLRFISLLYSLFLSLFLYFLCANFVLLFSLFDSESWPRQKQISLVNLHPTLFLRCVVNLDPIILEKRWIDGESWPNNFVTEVKTCG